MDGEERIVEQEGIDKIVRIFMDHGFLVKVRSADRKFFGNQIIVLERAGALVRVIDDRGVCFAETFQGGDWCAIEDIIGVKIGSVLTSEAARSFLRQIG